jgi:hypothetical protein
MNGIDQTPIDVPPLVQTKDPWYKSKRVQGVALLIAVSVLQKFGLIGAELAGWGQVIGGGWAGLGAYNAQNRGLAIATAIAQDRGVPVPPLKSMRKRRTDAGC